VSAPTPNYAHRATFLKGHDGDSFWLQTDFGMNTHGVRLSLPLYCRLYGIDALELSQKGGADARDFTNAALSSAKVITVQTIKPDGTYVGDEKYGRWLVRVWVDDQELADGLRAAGYEKPK
jgi:endonuclease YncB( thermonuclease family)